MDLAITELSLAHVLVLFSAMASAAYTLVWLPQTQSTARSLMKIAPMIILIVAALIAPLPVMVIAALGACTVGDWFLSLEGETNFLSGLGAFLAGHLFYIVYFAGSLDPAMLFTFDTGLLVIILLALVAMVLLRLWPYLNEMRIPVAVYALIIALMALAARLANPGTLILAGIALFMISDIILAQDKFTPLTNTPARKIMPWMVWILYSAGQALIVFGLLSST